METQRKYTGENKNVREELAVDFPGGEARDLLLLAHIALAVGALLVALDIAQKLIRRLHSQNLREGASAVRAQVQRACAASNACLSTGDRQGDRHAETYLCTLVPSSSHTVLLLVTCFWP